LTAPFTGRTIRASALRLLRPDFRPMPPLPSRRSFMVCAAAAAAAPAPVLARPRAPQDEPAALPAGLPAAGLSPGTIAEAEKLAAVAYTEHEREMIVNSISEQVEWFRARRALAQPNARGPAQTFDPRLPGQSLSVSRNEVVRSDADPGPLPAHDIDIAFAPVTQLSRWIESRQITSTRLTGIYLDRLKRLGPKLECVITLMEEQALQQARVADAEIAAGRWRGPLHGVPWGAKDLFDTAGVRTTFGAEPWVDRRPLSDATVVRRLREAGAILIAKLSLGALAYNDRWFDGWTRNPWNPEQGSSGSSAGSAAAVAAGLAGFALGTETYGSIVSPCMRCGTTGLRPTFGRVSRTGAMALCWSLDKIGPIARTVEDCALVLAAINGADAGDPSSVDVPFQFDAKQPMTRSRKLVVGWSPAWFEGEAVHPLDRTALNAIASLGVEMKEIDLPEWPYDSMISILLCEAAAAFEEITLTNIDDTLDWQEAEAWPNTFRRAWFIPGIEYVQAERLRRQCMEMMAEHFAEVNAIISPSFAAHLLLITNMTGHPSLTLRTGLRDDGTPRGITLWGRLFDEGTLCRLGLELEKRLDVWRERPPLAAARP
jgi:Asp-tRNA(Asn)/Glu-tRNA(Gln) amidotransferase A subunit family amidase